MRNLLDVLADAAGCTVKELSNGEFSLRGCLNEYLVKGTLEQCIWYLKGYKEGYDNRAQEGW